MKWELYLTRQEWEEIKAAVRDRAPKDAKGRPMCEREGCKNVHGRLKRSKAGYLVPHWLHTAHLPGSDMRSKDPNDYLALCDSCHMWLDRQPDDSGWVPRHRRGYSATTTADLIISMRTIGLELVQVDNEVWCWRIGDYSGMETSPVLAAAAAVARLAHRFDVQAVAVPEDGA